MPVTYDFASLKELADFLDRRASETSERALQLQRAGSMPQRDVDLFQREAAGIRSAANVVRNARLTTGGGR